MLTRLLVSFIMIVAGRKAKACGGEPVNKKIKAFKDALTYISGEGIVRCNLVFDDTILQIGGDIPASAETIDIPTDAIVLPGFIDEHVHGAGGADAMDGSVTAISTIANTLATEGTTSFLATTMTQSRQNIINALACAREYANMNCSEGARLLGVHLEGPFISVDYKGAQMREFITAPDVALFDEFDDASGGIIKIVTVAPETNGASALIAHLSAKGRVASIGHSAADNATVAHAVGAGASCVTHTFNAQSPLNHRDIGVAGNALLDDRLTCELIADCVHVSKDAIKLLVKTKPHDKIVLITDAIRAKGMPEGESELGGQKVTVENGIARLTDGTLAGSVLRMNVAIRNLVEKVGVPLTQAVDYATINPAKNLGVSQEFGSISINKRADFAVIARSFDVLFTFKNGRSIYSSK